MDSVIAMLARGVTGGWRLARGPVLSILIFHRVHAHVDPLFPDEPDAARFDMLMRHVAATYRVLTLGEAVSALAAGALPSRSLVITFDDGYADNEQIALPILLRHGLRASFFISTGFLDGGRMWNDSVIACIRGSRREILDLEPFGLEAMPLSTPAMRRHAIDALLPRIKYLGLQERESAIGNLQSLAGAGPLPNDLMMTTSQVRGLHAAGMEIGGHTVNHPILTAIEPKLAEQELVRGKQDLESLIDAPVDMLAYPNGRPGRDYAACHVEMARRVGFRGAVSTAIGVSRVGDDLFQLPRFTPWQRSMAHWSARLAWSRGGRTFARV